jgi:HSP20 family molecular chaperone IbpA
MNEETKHEWLKIGTIALVTFLVSYLAFCIALKHHSKKMHNPFYQAERLEKYVEEQERDFDKFLIKEMENPFMPKMRPMFVNLVKETNEYKVIVDLTQFEDEEALNVDIKDNELTVKGEFDKNVRGTEKIINFMQTYYLDEKLDEENISRERKGNKYIITIPFKD